LRNVTEVHGVLVRVCLTVLIIAAGAGVALAQEERGRPGDYGYRHQQYHHNGVIDELRRKTGRSCCDGVGECRATYVDLRQKQALIDGKWCPLGDAAVRQDITLPDQFALVCAGTAAWPLHPCPIVYCVAVAPGS
jgi:hypothetical protein